jgi:O-antigen/teichoic acid export membrane protein
LGTDAFGIILFSQTVSVVLVAVLELGLSSTTIREVAAHWAGEAGYVRELFRTATLLYWCAYLLLSAGVVLLAPAVVGNWINLTTMDPSIATHLVQILALGSLLALPRSLYASLLRGLQEMGFNNVIEVGTLAGQQLGVIVILLLRGGPFAVAIWLGASSLLGLSAYFAVCGRFVGWKALLPGYSAAAVGRNLRFSGHMAVISMSSMIHMQSDKLAVSKLLPIGELGTYGFASTLASGISRVTASVVQAAFPAFSALHQQGDRAGLQRQYRRMHLLVTCLVPPFFAALMFATLPIFSYVFDRSTAHALIAPVALLCAGWFFNATLNIPYVLSLAVGRPDIAARQNLLGLVIVLPVTILSVVGFGLAGAAFSWVFYQLFAYAYGVPRICRECLHVPVLGWYLDVGKVGAVIVGTYGLGYVVALRVGGDASLSLALCYSVATLLYAGGGYLAAGKELRNLLAVRAPSQSPWRAA